MINEYKKPYSSHITRYGKLKNNGYYHTPEEAHKVWQMSKKEYIEELIDIYKNDVSIQIISGLQNIVDMLDYDIQNNLITKSLKFNIWCSK
ncbi:hypothetical protein A4_398 [Escherichia phage A4]|nr:hypothetical protein A4_398 [Escherichia phage A4]